MELNYVTIPMTNLPMVLDTMHGRKDGCMKENLVQLSDQIAASPELMRLFQRERLGTEITELIVKTMEEKKISTAELATRMGKDQAFITELLKDSSNISAKTLSDVFCAMDTSVRIVPQPLSVFTPNVVSQLTLQEAEGKYVDPDEEEDLDSESYPRKY
jgi:transcriptional regulator with XRE-family HTH domain